MSYPDALKPGTQFGSYEIKETLGSSSSGFTYRARDLDQERDVTVQEFLPAEVATRHWSGIHVMPLNARSEAFERGLTHFLQEARILSQIHDPYVCRVNEYTEANATAYLIMDYESGQTLSTYLASRESPLTEDELRKLLIPILKGLRVIHSAGLLHRDINPNHIFLRDVGPPVLIGFGSTHRAMVDTDIRVDSRVTPGYSPVEQYHEGDELGPWTDLYALGATMYRCIARVVPVESTRRIAAVAQGDEDPLVPAQEIGRGDYSTSLLGTIDWMLQPMIKDRPDSVGAVLGLLSDTPKTAEAQTSGAGTTDTLQRRLKLAHPPRERSTASLRLPAAPALRVEPEPRAERRGRRAWRRSAFVVLAVAIAAGGVLAAVLWRQPDSQLAKTEDSPPPPPAAVSPGTAETAVEPPAAGPDNEVTLAEPPPVIPPTVTFDREGDANRAAGYRALDFRDKQVEQLLESARAKLAAGKLVAPPADNALADFRAILAIDSKNVNAKQGIDEIVTDLVAMAKSALDEEDETRAERLLDTVDLISADDSGARTVRDQIAARRQRAEDERRAAEEARLREEQQRQERISSLLERADSAFAAGRVAEPSTDNALAHYRSVLTIDPDNEAARSGIARIGRHFLENANRALAANEFEQAEGFLIAAAAVQPDNEAIPLLREQLEARREIVRRERLEQQRVNVQRDAELAAKRTERQNLESGIRAYYNGAYDTSFRLLSPLAEKGHARAQFRVGMMYHLGRGTTQDAALADEWLRRALPAVQSAAGGGEAWAQADLGSLYEDGLVVGKNESEAARWYQLAADQGYAGAQTNLGVMYANGSGVPQDLDLAVKWLRRAAAQGDRVAQENLVTLGVK